MKKLVNLFLVLIVIVIFSACDSSTEPILDSEYFPLKVGNSWSYAGYLHHPDSTNGEITIEWTVIGTKVLGSFDYFEILEMISMSHTPRSYYYLKDNKLYKYDEEKKLPGLFADFNLEENQSFKYFDFNVTVTEKTDKTITYFYDHPSWVDEEHWITFEKGVGIKSFFSVWGIGHILVKNTILE